MGASKEKIRYILKFFWDKGVNANQQAENLKSIYGPDTETVNHAKFWFLRFPSGDFDDGSTMWATDCRNSR